MKKQVYFLAIAIAVCGCGKKELVERQSERNNIEDFSQKVRAVNTDTLIFSSAFQVIPAGGYYIVGDTRSTSKIFSVFSANDFTLKGRFGNFGHGNGELAAPGNIAYNADKNELYVSDFGKQSIMAFNVDSALSVKDYLPWKKAALSMKCFPDRYVFVSDTLCVGRVISPKGDNAFSQNTSFYNMQTGVSRSLPQCCATENSRSQCDVDAKRDVIAEVYSTNDLMALYNLKGEKTREVRGPGYKDEHSKDITHFTAVRVCGEKILAVYSGNDKSEKFFGETILVFESDGTYIKTLTLGASIMDLAFDKTANRVLLWLDSETPFAYFEMSDID